MLPDQRNVAEGEVRAPHGFHIATAALGLKDDAVKWFRLLCSDAIELDF
jgi:hypothetical protein